MNKIAAYILSAYSIICTEPVDKLLDVGNQSQNGNPIPSFDENLLINLCFETQLIFEKECNVLELNGDFIIVGDIHGSLHDLLRILKYIHEQKTKVLFLGDYVDRGNFSLECITILFAFKVLYPDSIYLIRGNHEFDSICSQYGFKDEIINYSLPQKQLSLVEYPEMFESLEDCKNSQIDSYIANHKNRNCYTYTETLYNAFIEAFSYLPIGAIINKTTFCVHGGLSPNFDHIDQLNKNIKRPIKTFEECKLLADLVWSDPSPHTNSTFDENPRGYGYLFNRESVYNFLKKNSLNRIIRAHQCVHKGCQKNFDDKCITVFSVSSYGKFLGNSSGILHISEINDRIEGKIFVPICHLKKNEAIYYKVQDFNQKNDDIRTCFTLAHPILPSRPLPSRLKLNKNLKQYKLLKNRKITSVGSAGSCKPSLIRPKFVTNTKKSYTYEDKNALFDQSRQNEYNEESFIIDENNKKYNMFNSAP